MSREDSRCCESLNHEGLAKAERLWLTGHAEKPKKDPSDPILLARHGLETAIGGPFISKKPLKKSPRSGLLPVSFIHLARCL